MTIWILLPGRHMSCCKETEGCFWGSKILQFLPHLWSCQLDHLTKLTEHNYTFWTEKQNINYKTNDHLGQDKCCSEYQAWDQSGPSILVEAHFLGRDTKFLSARLIFTQEDIGITVNILYLHSQKCMCALKWLTELWLTWLWLR